MNTKHTTLLDGILIGGLILFVITAYIFPLLGDDNHLLDWFSTDDAFYYFKVAENISRGSGSTFDGIAPTNGYHPLWMLILIPVFAFTRVNLIFPLRITVFVQLLLAAGTGWIAYQTLKTKTSRYTAFLFATIWVIYPPILNVTSNGTEAILNAFFLTMMWSKTVRLYQDLVNRNVKIRQLVELGLIGSLVLFSRLDNVFLLIVLGASIGVRFLFDNKKQRIKIGIIEAIKVEIAYFLPITVSLGVYMILNRTLFNTWMPISGQVKRYWGRLENTIYGAPITGIGDFMGEFFTPNLNMGPWAIVTKPLFNFLDSFQVDYYFGTQQISMGFLVMIVAAVIIGYLIRSHRDYIFDTGKVWFLEGFLIGALLQIAYYKLNGYLAPRAWYWILEFFLVVIFGSILLEIFCKTIQGVTKKFSPIPLVMITLLSVGLLVNPYLQRLRRGLGSEGVHFYLEKTSWIEERTDPGSLIGMTGSGSTAYFIKDRSVMNIDGLINGKMYFEQVKANQAANYLSENGVDYILGNQGILIGSDPYQANYQTILEQSIEVAVFQDKLKLWKLIY